MTSAIFSSSWYRVASLKPRLRSQARVLRHFYRGERYHLLQDRASGRFLRLNAAAYGVVAMFDGHGTLEEIWKFLCDRDGDKAPTQDEIVNLLTQLHQANVLLTDQFSDLDDMVERQERVFWQKFKQYLSNPLSFKVPLYDPDRLLTRLVALMPRWLSVILPWIWIVLVFSGGVQMAMHWDDLTHDIAARAFTTENMVLLWIAFPLLKAIHELGHGLAIKANGGACHEAGLMFLVMVPVPYIDASSTIAFADKGKRMVVGAAGVMVELAVAAVALGLWTGMDPGMGRALLHEVVLLAGLTTLIFNINPLIRFDGYYVLADAIEIPNLAQKANNHLGYLVNRYLFGLEEATPVHLTPGEAPWLVVYAVASFIYRMFIAAAIILLVARNYFFVGVVLAFWAAWGMLLQPLWKHILHVATGEMLEGRRSRAFAIVGFCGALLLGIVGLVPVSAWTMTEGVIWMPEKSRVRTLATCFGLEVRLPPGTAVRAGDELLTCTDPELDARYEQLREYEKEISSRLALATTVNRVQAQVAAFELVQVREQLADVQARRAAMKITSPLDGTFAMAAPGDFPGRFLKRGDVVGYVIDPSRFTLLAVVPQFDVDLVRSHTQRVELRSVDRIWELLPARIMREVPAATSDLPSLALSLAGGGKVGLDPENPEPKALAPLFQFELSFASDGPKRLGNRVYVRFVHDDAPLATQWGRSLRQHFLKWFAI